MNFNTSRILDQMPRTLDTSQLEKSSEPAHQVLSKLIHNCSPDPATQTALTTALILSNWQLRADTLSKHTPSLILLNAGSSIPDPVDDFIANFTGDRAVNEKKDTKDRHGIPIDQEKAHDIMANAIHDRDMLGPASKHDIYDKRNVEVFQGHFQHAKHVAVGTQTAIPYSLAWTNYSGFLSDENDVLIARLNKEPDRAAFRRDLNKCPNKLLIPSGRGYGLEEVSKRVSVSGSFTVDLWDEEFVMDIIKLGLPILFVPHIAKQPLAVSNPWALDAFPGLWRNAPISVARTSLELPPMGWFETHTDDIRRRLHLLPGRGTYEFAVLQVLHQLGSVCLQIANFAGKNREGKPDHIMALMWDLHARALRGITLGVAALAWHGLGFDPGCPRETAVKVLRSLRKKGPMSRNDIRRKFHLESKEQRDILLERLVAEDLVRIDEQTVTAASFEEFVTALHTRPELPEAANFRKAADGEDQA